MYSKYGLSDRMLHPLFGCNPQDRVVDIPLYTQLDELLPKTPVTPSIHNRRRRATGVDGELQHYSSMGGFGYTDIDEVSVIFDTCLTFVVKLPFLFRISKTSIS